MIALALLSCAEPPPRRHAEEPDERLTLREQLVRRSLDLRGVRPTADELREVEDRADLDVLTEEFLYDERFAGRMTALYREVLLTRMEELLLVDRGAVRALLDDEDAFRRAVGEEPVQLLAHLAVEDLPYDLAVTGDFTVVDEVLAQAWPTDRDPDATGWVPAHYTDGRPAAGVLATNGLWWRFASTDSNMQRKRANVTSRLFVCRDFLKTEVPFTNDVNLLDERALADAIRTQPSCTGCHDTLEPIASYFWGFDFYFDGELYLDEARFYAPENERGWRDATGVPPGWFGRRGDSLADLGRQIAADDAFDPCAVQHVFRWLLHRDPGGDDLGGTVADAVAAFRAEGRTVRSAIRALLADPHYAGVGEADGRKVLTPDLLRTAVSDLTGFDWEVRGAPVLEREREGVATLAGGIDGQTVTVPAYAPNTPMMLVQDRLATGAAAFAIRREARQAPGERRLLREIPELATSPDRAALRGQLAALALDVLSLELAPDGPEVAAWEGLFREVEGLAGASEAAWAAVLAAMLRDPLFVTY